MRGGQIMSEGKQVCGSAHHFAKLNEDDVRKIRHLLEQREKVRKLMEGLTLEAIGKLSSKAPPEIVRLLRQVSDRKKIADEDWWRLLEEVARCLGQIGDPDACKELQRVDRVLSSSYQDYKMWYAVRKAMAAINPEQTTFDRPAADILDSYRVGKIITRPQGYNSKLRSAIFGKLH